MIKSFAEDLFFVFLWVVLIASVIWAGGWWLSRDYMSIQASDNQYEARDLKTSYGNSKLSLEKVYIENGKVIFQGEYKYGLSEWYIRIYDEQGLIMDRKIARAPDLLSVRGWQTEVVLPRTIEGDSLFVYIFPLIDSSVAAWKLTEVIVL